MELPKLLYLGLAFVTLGFVAPALEADPAPDIAVPVTADAVNDQFFAFDFQVIAICNWNDRIFKGNFHALGGTYAVEFKPNAAVTVGIPHRGVLTMTLDKPNCTLSCATIQCLNTDSIKHGSTSTTEIAVGVWACRSRVAGARLRSILLGSSTVVLILEARGSDSAQVRLKTMLTIVDLRNKLSYLPGSIRRQAPRCA